MKRYWVIAPYDSTKSDLFDHAWRYDLENGTIAVGWRSMGDITGLSREEFKRRYDDTHGKNTRQFEGGFWRFHHEIRIGDRIIARRGLKRIIGVGEVTGTAFYDVDMGKDRVGDDEEYYANFLRVTWEEKDISFEKQVFSRITVYEIDESKFSTLMRGEHPGSKSPKTTHDAIIDFFKTVEECEPDKHNGAYELVRVTVDLLRNVPPEELDICDLDMLYHMTIGIWKSSFDYKKSVIDKSNLLDEDKEHLTETLDRILQDSEDGKYESKPGVIGMFGTGFYSFVSHGMSAEDARKLVEMCIRILDEDDEEALFKIVEEGLRRDIHGIGTASISQILHCIKPTVFPILNSWGIDVFRNIGLRLVKPGDPKQYIENCRRIKQYRDDNFTFKNYRVFDVYNEEIEAIIEGKGVDITQKPYLIEDFVRETGFDDATIEGWERCLLRKKHVIFQGPPGTGKTFIAERLAKLVVAAGEGFWELVQFHPSYAYEDFIQGYRPRPTEQGGFEFELVSGRFLEFCERARRTDSPCVLIIDEINRAHLSRVFGELMYLLEYRDKEIPLASSKEPFQVPDNVYLIGTMNTADRSIALVDHALRRRFTFIRLKPDFNVLRKHLAYYEYPAESLISVIRDVNNLINDQNYEIGISYFMKDRAELREHLQTIWVGEIEPYLDEFFYDQPDKVNPYRWQELLRSRLNDWDL